MLKRLERDRKVKVLLNILIRIEIGKKHKSLFKNETENEIIKISV